MKACFSSIDVESDLGGEGKFEGVKKMGQILALFKKYDIPATAFVTGEVLEKYSEEVKEWSEQCEIACHGFSHQFWNTLKDEERKEQLRAFISLYKNHFGRAPRGFRAPSHVIDEAGIAALEEEGFFYDSSIVPHYPPVKRYRGYRGRAPQKPYFPSPKDCRKKGKMKILEIPVSGLMFGIPLAGTWVAKIPKNIFQLLLRFSNPAFLTLNLHSWDSLDSNLLAKIEEILVILKEKNYTFLTGEKIYQSHHGNLSENSKQNRVE